jgi:hypothetical protein
VDAVGWPVGASIKTAGSLDRSVSISVSIVDPCRLLWAGLRLSAISGFSALDRQLDTSPQFIAWFFFNRHQLAGSFGNVFEIANQGPASFARQHMGIGLEIFARPDAFRHSGLEFGALILGLVSRTLLWRNFG